MNHWPYEVKPYSPNEVTQYAVDDPPWQKFRISLKGLSTTRKLDQLDRWLHMSETIPRARQVQVDNYIGALLRGGQLKHVNGRIEVQR